MASSISPPTPPPHHQPHKLSVSKSHKFFHTRKRPFYPSSSHSFPTSICRCSSNSSPWNAAFQGVIKKIESFFNNDSNTGIIKNIDKGKIGNEKITESEVVEEDEWNWDRWKKHFNEIDEQEQYVVVLKSQLARAVSKEDYDDAARIKVAIAAAATNDSVGRVMSQFNRAVAEERYLDAAFLRDNAGAGLVGWWSGISEDAHDPYGLIIRITAEHGRYVARSYSPRQLANAAFGVPVFEIFLTKNKKGDFKQQAVYLKREGRLLEDPFTVSSKASGSVSRASPPGPTEGKKDLFAVSTEETEEDDDTEDGSDLAEGLPGFQNILQDMIPGVKVKVLKVTTSAKVDSDFLSKVIEQIIDDEDDEENIELESVESEDDSTNESDQESEEIEIDSVQGIIEDDGPSKISVKVVVGGLPEKASATVFSKKSLRVPAKLEKKGRRSFSFSIEKDTSDQDSSAKKAATADRKAKLQGQRSVDSIMLDLAKLIGQKKIPTKVLKDVGDLINFTLSQAEDRQPLSGSTTFHQIETSPTLDPLNGLYLGTHGHYSSEVIQLQRKLGHWQDDHSSKESSNLEFYEYVEALKLTGDPYVPAGQVAFRAKVGKRYQLPHKGIIPEEFGVIARYKGQGRLAEPGFKNPKWVDGELVILDGKFIKGGPVVGFVYWAPEYPFLVFFNRLRLQP